MSAVNYNYKSTWHSEDAERLALFLLAYQCQPGIPPDESQKWQQAAQWMGRVFSPESCRRYASERDLVSHFKLIGDEDLARLLHFLPFYTGKKVIRWSDLHTTYFRKHSTRCLRFSVIRHYQDAPLNMRENNNTDENGMFHTANTDLLTCLKTDYIWPFVRLVGLPIEHALAIIDNLNPHIILPDENERVLKRIDALPTYRKNRVIKASIAGIEECLQLDGNKGDVLHWQLVNLLSIQGYLMPHEVHDFAQHHPHIMEHWGEESHAAWTYQHDIRPPVFLHPEKMLPPIFEAHLPFTVDASIDVIEEIERRLLQDDSVEMEEEVDLLMPSPPTDETIYMDGDETIMELH